MQTLIQFAAVLTIIYFGQAVVTRLRAAVQDYPKKLQRRIEETEAFTAKQHELLDGIFAARDNADMAKAAALEREANRRSEDFFKKYPRI